MTLQQMKDFLSIVDHGSLHAAARATGQTQPALTRSLRRLETALGAPLLDRHARGMEPNAFGRSYVSHVRRIVADVQRAQDAMREALGQQAGRVTFGISAAASILLAPQAVKRFRREFPLTELRSRAGLYHSLVPLLRDGQLDFFISPMPAGPVDPQLASRTLIDSQMVLVARRDHAKAISDRLQDVSQERFVIGGPRGQPGAGIFDVFEAAGLPPPQIEVQTDGLLDSAAMVAGSDCLALLPAALMRSGLLHKLLVVLPITDGLPAYTVAMFERAQVPPTAAAAALAVQFERESAYLRQSAA